MPDPNSYQGGTKPSLLQIIGSVVSAAFGVQSSANRERDFSGGSAKAYVIGGVIFTVIFVITVITVVNRILS